MKSNHILTSLMAAACLAACSQAEDMTAAQPAVAEAEAPVLARTASPVDASVFFITPLDGAVVTSPVTLEFGSEGIAVVPAGDTTADSGHHHILIDTGLPDLGLPIPKDEQHVHFGDGSSTAELALTPGEHNLQLLLGDHLHIPHQPPVVSERITITVE